MAERAYELHGVPVLELPAQGPQLGNDRDAVDLVGKTWSNHAKLLAIPVGRLTEEFFSLKTRVAGEMLHRLLLYKVRVATVGDVSRYIEESDSFRDFVVESNRGNQVWFVASVEELGERLSRT
jgi:hypothetical protein